MDSYHVVLYIHFLSLLVGFGAGAAETICLLKLRNARTLADAAPWGRLAGEIEKAFPVAIVGLYGSGIYMTHHFWSFGTSWIVIPIVGLAVLALQGPLVAGRQGHKLKAALMANGPGDLGPESLHLARNPLLFAAGFSNEGLVLAIIWVMTVKPGWGGAIAAVVIGYAAGVAAALGLTRAPVTEAAPAAETT